MQQLILSAVIFAFLWLPAWTACSARAANIPEISQLDRILGEKSKYDLIKWGRIDSLKVVASRQTSEAARVRAWIRIGDEFTLFKADSALIYYNRAISLSQQTHDLGGEYLARLRKIRPEVITGFYSEAHDDLRKFQQMQLPDSILPELYESGYRVYSFALNSIEKGHPYYNSYYALTQEYRKKWIATLPEGSTKRRLYKAEQAFSDNRMAQAKSLLSDLIGELRATSHEYAIATAIYAKIYRLEGRLEEAAKYNALSAISDIECAVKENQSIFSLSMLLYNMGDIERSYRYLFASIEDAAFCNAQVRVYNASRLLPVIEGAHREEEKSHSRIMETFIVIMSLLLVGMVIAILMMIRQMKELSQARHKLSEANTNKDAYMGQFLDLCSVYMKRLDSFTKLVNRKLTLGQADDLAKMTKSARFSEEQHRGFYHEFDVAFLKIYPTFITEVNALLHPEEQIRIDTPGTLTTELRIYALLRLGMDDSSRIAEFLRYSVNTIYAYRNKMKNKAIDRANFETSVMKIGVIE